jgi:hypothetical protein
MDKAKFIKWVKEGCNWESGLQLFLLYGKNPYYIRNLKLRGENEKTREDLRYSLMKLADLKEREVAVLIKGAGRPKKEETLIRAAFKGNKKAISLREEFSFLGEASCPDILKVLVADMLSAYDRYRKAYADLDDTADLFVVARDVVDNFIENRDIWKELNHYKETGKVLGNHPIFNRQKRFAAFQQMKLQELIKLKKNTEFNIWRNKALIEKKDKPHLNGSRQEKIKELEADLKELNRLIA